MGKFVVIGLGLFGEYAAKSLMGRGNEVLFPNRQTAVRPGDVLILAGRAEALEKIKRMKPSRG